MTLAGSGDWRSRCSAASLCFLLLSSFSLSPQVIVVGGGLAGLSAAHTVLERGGRCLVIDKKDFLGGNSVKATSGINGTPTSTQAQQGIPDNAHVFYNDTALSAAGQSMNEIGTATTAELPSDLRSCCFPRHASVFISDNSFCLLSIFVCVVRRQEGSRERQASRHAHDFPSG